MATEQTVLAAARKIADSLTNWTSNYNESASGAAATLTVTPTSGKSLRIKGFTVTTNGATVGTWDIKKVSTIIMKGALGAGTIALSGLSIEGAVDETFTIETSAIAAQVQSVSLFYQEF